MISVKEAVDTILTAAKPKNIAQDIYMTDALDRICFNDIYSNIDIPTFNRSAMDGYALVFGKDKTKYRIVDNENELKENCCIRINTGFAIPDKCDAVAEVEKVKVQDRHLIVNEEISLERNFTKRATELSKGELLVAKGEKISAKKYALLAYSGIVNLKVYQEPIIATITTGDEVVYPSCSLPTHSVFNSNYFILDGLLKKWGMQHIPFGHIEDNKNIFADRLKYALERCDVVLTTGGVSKGTKDYTKDVLNYIGAKILFENSTIKPGKPASFACYKDKYIFSLPGWPAALYSVAYIYLQPFLHKLSGFKHYQTKFYEGILTEDMHSQAGKDYFNRVSIDYKDGIFYLKSAGSQKTDNYLSIAKADGLVWIDKNKSDVKKGSKLPFIFLSD